jgi:predicted outer membrane repeat protein
MRILLLISFIVTTNAMAATIVVTNTNNAGAGSLRQAIISASAGDTVKMDPMLIATGSQTINLLTEISINKNLYIKGIFTSYDTLYISGMDSCRIFNMTSGTVTLYGCTLVHGKSSGGGAITQTGGTLVVDHCNLMYNHSTGYGGAISKNGGTAITIKYSHLFSNTSESYGGAIYFPPGGGHTVSYSTFKNNHSDDYGGAMYGFVANTDFDHCTFVGNDATTQGGAIYDWGSAVILNITNCTVVGNTSASVGGIEHWGSSIVFTITSSIVAGNTGANLDIWGAGAVLNSGGYNYIGDASYAGAVGTDNLSASLPALNLTALQDNGSYTFTRMPMLGSPAINDGNPADPSAAQNAPISGVRDAGAAEYYACPDKLSSFFVLECTAYTVPSGNGTYSTSGLTVVNDTIPTSCGADSVMTIYIYIGDISAPVPDNSVLADVTGECSYTPTAPTATDACLGAITGTTTTTFPITTIGTTVVTWTYNDGLGNITTQNQNVIITPLNNTVSLAGVTLTSNSVGTTYQWLNCNTGNSPIAGATNQSFTPSGDGSYAVQISNGSCIDTSACTTVTGTGLMENANENFTIYPNPTNGIITLENAIEGSLVTIYSVEGKIILSETNVNGTKQEFDLTGIERGVYFVKVNKGSAEKTIRLIVQ